MLLNLLASNNFITYNKPIAQIVGVAAAIVLGELCSYQNLAQIKSDTIENITFYVREEIIERDTGLGEKAIRSARLALKNAGIIDYKKQGMPAKYYYTINEAALESLLKEFFDIKTPKKCTIITENSPQSGLTSQLCQKGTTSGAEKAQQVVPFWHHCNNNIINNITNKCENNSVCSHTREDTHSLDIFFKAYPEKQREDISIPLDCDIDLVIEKVNESKFLKDSAISLTWLVRHYNLLKINYYKDFKPLYTPPVNRLLTDNYLTNNSVAFDNIDEIEV